MQPEFPLLIGVPNKPWGRMPMAVSIDKFEGRNAEDGSEVKGLQVVFVFKDEAIGVVLPLEYAGLIKTMDREMTELITGIEVVRGNGKIRGIRSEGPEFKA